MLVMLLTEYHLELISLKGGCTSSSESTFVRMPHRWKSHVTAQFSVSDQLTAKWYSEHKLFVCTLDGNMDYYIQVNSKPNAEECKEIVPGQTAHLRAMKHVRWFI